MKTDFTQPRRLGTWLQRTSLKADLSKEEELEPNRGPQNAWTLRAWTPIFDHAAPATSQFLHNAAVRNGLA
jgi:hypothetical protein